MASFGWGVASEPGPIGGGGGGAGRAVSEMFQVDVLSSTADPGFLAAVASGRHFRDATLHVRNEAGQEVRTIRLEETLFQSWDTSQSGGALEITFAEIRDEVRAVNPDGTLAAPVNASWDVETNVVSGMIVGMVPPATQVASNTFDILNPVPEVNAIAPPTAPESSSAAELLIVGQGFVSTSVVTWSGTPLDVAFIDGTQLMATVPADLVKDQVNATIVVSNPTPGGGSSAPQPYQVFNVAPQGTLDGPALAVPGQSLTFSLSANDSSPVDQAEGFTLAIDWGDGTSLLLTQSSDTTVQHTYSQPKSGPGGDIVPYNITLSVTDKDLATSVFTRAVLVQPIQLEQGRLLVGGTTGRDQIVLQALDSQTVEVFLNRESLGAYQPSNIVVFSQAGDDRVRIVATTGPGPGQPLHVPAIIDGGAGDDWLEAGGCAAAVALFGGAGKDRLRGGQDRDLLVGGDGSDSLDAGAAGSILIGGSTDYDIVDFDPDQAAKLAALEAILAEWSRNDLPGGVFEQYLQRVDHLRGISGGGLNDQAFLNATTVHDDGDADKLSGKAGLDWFFLDLDGMDKQKPKDRNPRTKLKHSFRLGSNSPR